MPTFKEVHIHGPIWFSQDVECVYAPVQEINNNREVVERFTKRFKVPVYEIYSPK
jgi:hypothetical protein